jgi:hypothetical protein
MYDIDGGKDWKNGVWSVMCGIQFVLVVLIFIHVAIMFYDDKAQFQNMPDYGIGQRGDVIAAVPSYEEESMRQKVDRWTKGAKSQLTGTRDVPVFFQDYDVEMQRKSANGAVATAREGFEGGRGDDELERALAGRN